jgi:NAD-dependent dihydropyrimidine dehydrogenase PreA subunit
VLHGIAAAAGAGLGPVKVNMVVKRGCNEQSILPMAARFRGSGHVLRFIEYIDVGTTNRWRLDDVVPAAEIIALIGGQWPLEPLPASYPGEVATRYRYRDGAGEIGIVASVTQPFCRSCTRARLSAEGKLYTCLFAGSGHDLRATLRGGVSDQALREQIAAIWTMRADRYSELRTRATGRMQKVEMSHIGASKPKGPTRQPATRTARHARRAAEEAQSLTIYQGERMLCIHPGECVSCDAREPVCPVEAIFCEGDMPERWAQFTSQNARFSGQLGSPGGAAETGALPATPAGSPVM